MSHLFPDADIPTDFVVKICKAIIAEWDDEDASYHKLTSPSAFYDGIFAQYLHRSIRREQNEDLPGDAHILQALVRMSMQLEYC